MYENIGDRTYQPTNVARSLQHQQPTQNRRAANGRHPKVLSQSIRTKRQRQLQRADLRASYERLLLHTTNDRLQNFTAILTELQHYGPHTPSAQHNLASGHDKCEFLTEF